MPAVSESDDVTGPVASEARTFAAVTPKSSVAARLKFTWLPEQDAKTKRIEGALPVWIAVTWTLAAPPPPVPLSETVVTKVPSPVPGSAAPSANRLIATSALLAMTLVADVAVSQVAFEATEKDRLPHCAWLRT